MAITWTHNWLHNFYQHYDNSSLPNKLLFVCHKGFFIEEFIQNLVKSFYCKNHTYCCNKCDNCKTINEKDSRYLHIIGDDITKEIKVDYIHNLIKFCQKTTIEEKRFIVIYNCHLLNIYAANAILKTIEELSPNIQMIFVTHNSNLVIPTILSRFIVYNLSKPVYKDICEYLYNSYSYIDKEDIHKSLYITNISIENALQILQEKSLSNFDNILINLCEINKKNWLSIAEKWQKSMLNNLQLFFEFMQIICHSCLEMKHLHNMEKKEINIKIPQTWLSNFEKIQIKYSQEKLLFIYDYCCHVLENIYKNKIINIKIHVEHLTLLITK